MAKAEAARSDGIEAVAVVTPNHLHAAVAEAFLKAGIHVICDKPLATSTKEARRLEALATKHRRVFAVTYNYTGYPMVREARQRVRDGLLGEIRVVQVEYAQDLLTESLESTIRSRPSGAPPGTPGAGGCVGDILRRVFAAAGYVAGLEVSGLCAELSTSSAGARRQRRCLWLTTARGALWATRSRPAGLRPRVYVIAPGSSGARTGTISSGAVRRTDADLARHRRGRGGAGCRGSGGAIRGHLEAFATLWRDRPGDPRRTSGGAEGRPRGPVPRARRRPPRRRVHRGRGRVLGPGRSLDPAWALDRAVLH
jgi:predicted dehydrogenase